MCSKWPLFLSRSLIILFKHHILFCYGCCGDVNDFLQSYKDKACYFLKKIVSLGHKLFLGSPIFWVWMWNHSHNSRVYIVIRVQMGTLTGLASKFFFSMYRSFQGNLSSASEHHEQNMNIQLEFVYSIFYSRHCYKAAIKKSVCRFKSLINKPVANVVRKNLHETSWGRNHERHRTQKGTHPVLSVNGGIINYYSVKL